MIKVFRRAADPVPTPPDTVVIELSLDQAELLMTLVSNIGGSPTDDRLSVPMVVHIDPSFYKLNIPLSRRTRDLTNALFEFLRAARVKSLSRIGVE